MARRRRIDPDVLDALHTAVRSSPPVSAAALARSLDQRFPGRAPSERTVRDIVRELTPPDPSGPFRPGPDVDPQDAALVLEALAVAAWRNGWWPALGRDTAAWLAWLRRGWPDLDPVTAFVLAHDYRARTETGRETADLDAFLAFAPWRGADPARRYQEVRHAGIVPDPPGWYLTALMVQHAQRFVPDGPPTWRRRRASAREEQEAGDGGQAREP